MQNDSAIASPTHDRRHEKLTGTIIKVFFDVYNELGSGFLESVYANAMAIALSQSGLRVQPQVPICVTFRGQAVGDFFADLLVDDAVILELKAARAMDPIFESQLLNYLRATQIEIGLLMNFGPKPEFKRLAFTNSRKAASAARMSPQVDVSQTNVIHSPQVDADTGRSEMNE
jgi:GxxExxY protein